MAYNAMKLRCFPNFAVCGNGIIEVSETCEDGNTTSCDGCSSSCRIEACGNGVQECSEECDDGPLNGAPGSLCSTSCQQIIQVPDLRIGGGGPRSTDCGLRWSLHIDPSKVTTDRRGFPRNLQRCQDGDPTCDLEPAPNRCRMRVFACVGEADPESSCSAGTVFGTTIKKPKSTSRHPNEVLAHGALAAALADLGLPKGPASKDGQFCRPFEVDIPVNRRKVVLKVQATTGGKPDRDALKLFCDRS